MTPDELKNSPEKAELWARRRQLGIPTNKRLFVIACMDERFPLNEALGITEGDAHIFRNAGALVTDDAIRSAMLSTHFAGTKEIIIVNHTGCGLGITTSQNLIDQLRAKGIDVGTVPISPALPELKLEDQPKNFAKWLHTFTDVDALCHEQIELLRNSPLIPKDTVIHGYIWQVETMSLRRPK